MQINQSNPQRVPRAGTSPPRPANLPQQQYSTSTPPTPLKNKKRSILKKPVFVLTIFALAAITAIAIWHSAASQINTNQYQAVFLSNGQAYFGKLHDYYTGRPYMTDVYYFQSNNQPAGSTQTASGNQLLVKLGQEIHAPENKLILNKDSILFVENLSDSGKVVEAINKDKQAGVTSQPAGGIAR